MLATLELIKISKKLFRGTFPVFAIASSTACSVSYYVEDTNTVHTIGFSHLQMRVPNSNAGKVVVHQVSTYGIGAGSLREGGFLTLGYSENTVFDFNDDMVLCFVWPTGELIDLGIESIKSNLEKGICNNELYEEFNSN